MEECSLYVLGWLFKGHEYHLNNLILTVKYPILEDIPNHAIGMKSLEH